MKNTTIEVGSLRYYGEVLDLAPFEMAQRITAHTGVPIRADTLIAIRLGGRAVRQDVADAILAYLSHALQRNVTSVVGLRIYAPAPKS